MKLTESRLRKIIREELKESLAGARHQGISTGRHNLEPKNGYYQIKHELEDRASEETISGMQGFRYNGYFWHVARGGVRIYEPSELEREGQTARTKLHVLIEDGISGLDVKITQNGRAVETFEFSTGSDAIDQTISYL